MIYFDNIHPDFEPVPVDPNSVTGIRMRKNGTTLIWQLGRMDVITSTNFFDCCYAGKMIVPKGTYVGPLVGHSGPIIEFENCLVAADVECTRVNCATICKSGTDGNVHVNNCYFKTALNITQGRYADENALASGEICYRLNADRQEPVWFQTTS